MNSSISKDVKNDLQTLPKDIENTVNTMHEQEIPNIDLSAVNKRISSSLAAKEAALEAENSPSILSNVGLWLGQNRGLSTSAFASLSILFIAGMLVTSGTKTAFADVVNALKQVTFMQYVAEMRANNTVFMRNRVYYKQPGQIRTEILNAEFEAHTITVTDLELGKSLILMPAQQVAMPIDFTPLDTASSNSLEQPMSWYYSLINASEANAKTLENEYFNGIETERYLVTVNSMEINLWVDPAYDLPIKIEMSSYADETEFNFTAEIDYELRLDNDLFDLDAQGYQILGPDSD